MGFETIRRESYHAVTGEELDRKQAKSLMQKAYITFSTVNLFSGKDD